MGAGYEAKNCSVAWASRSINKTRECSAVISSHRNEALKTVRAHAMQGAIVAQGRPGEVLGLASGYMATLVPVHVASFDTRRASLSPDRLQYWAAWRLSSGRSDVPVTGCCTWVHESCNLDRWLQLLRHFFRQRTAPSRLHIHRSASQYKPIWIAFEVVRAKTKTRASYLVAARSPAHPWTRLPCYGGQDQDRQGRKDARVADRAYPLSLITAAGR